MELQFVKPKKHDLEWIFPTLAFEYCKRDNAPYFTIGLMTGHWITRLRLYWNISA
jgi:hypothetical protein